MEVKISEMVSGVLKYLDENEEMIVDKTEFGYPATSLTDLVAEVLPDVAERTIAEAERGDIDEWLEMEGDFEWVSPGTGEMELPEDFLRLAVFRMSDWKRSVSVAVSSDSPVYSLRFNPGCDRKRIRKSPMVAVVEGRGRRKLEFTGSNDAGAYVELAGYVPRPAGDDPEKLRIPRSLVKRVVMNAASKVREIRI